MPSASRSPAPLSFQALQAAFQRQDAWAFGQIAEALSWPDLPAQQLVDAVEMGLTLGLLQLPRTLVARGRKLHPQESQLAKLASLLAPARVIRSAPASGAAHEADLRWLWENSQRYAGRWVALRDGTLAAAAVSREDLRRQLAGAAGGLTITKVPGSPAGI